MARFVKISAIGPAPPVGGAGKSAPEAVKEMIRFWESQAREVLPDNPDIIVVPEASDRYADHSPAEREEYFIERKNAVRDFWAETASNNGCHVAYSALRAAGDGTFRNSTQIIGPSGEILGVYDKCHPTLGELESGVKPGPGAHLVRCGFGTVGCAICFDLNFNGLRESYAAAKPDLIIFSSVYHGGLMQNYWAYSTRAHFVGVIAGRPPSAVISPVGTILASSTNYCDSVTAEINLDCGVFHLDYNREKFADIKQKYGSGVRIFDPGHLGAVLISCESGRTGIAGLIEEFKLEPLDDYLGRALAARKNALGDS